MIQRFTTLAGAACVLALAGCQTMAPSSTGASAAVNPDCPRRAADPRIPEVVCLANGAACGVAVEVVADASGACQVHIGTEVVRMRRIPGIPSTGTDIIWWLAGTDKWEFRNEGIPFTAPVIFKDAGAASQFEASRAAGSAVWVRNRNTDTKKYEYKIRVFNKATGRPLESPDPAIFNDGP